ncbi:hypothetical protein [Candidatus Paracaedibacter symbiosus]|uniref:hypothetical protein n=1 Tax=Candidatus Paracaedibacter symbiosus TaxID=244582 RepID=UPI00050985E7|nr:hypothetical protein [Candidatus Paracaedibacter symbiosus]
MFRKILLISSVIATTACFADDIHNRTTAPGLFAGIKSFFYNLKPAYLKHPDSGSVQLNPQATELDEEGQSKAITSYSPQPVDPFPHAPKEPGETITAQDLFKSYTSSAFQPISSTSESTKSSSYSTMVRNASFSIGGIQHHRKPLGELASPIYWLSHTLDQGTTDITRTISKAFSSLGMVTGKLKALEEPAISEPEEETYDSGTTCFNADASIVELDPNLFNRGMAEAKKTAEGYVELLKSGGGSVNELDFKFPGIPYLLQNELYRLGRAAGRKPLQRLSQVFSMAKKH